MKTVVGLIVMVTIVLGTMVGCQTKPSEQAYRDLSVGPMTVSIPNDWQRPEDIDEIMNDIIGVMPPELAQYFQFDVYEPPAEEFALTIAVIKVSEMVELEGMTWEGWEAQMEADYMTKEDYLDYLATGLIMEDVEGFTHGPRFLHAIHGNEAIEGQFEFKVEGEPAKANVLLVFAEYDMGLVMIVGEEASIVEYEDVWDIIRDSVQFSY